MRKCARTTRRCTIDRAGARYGVSEVRHNEFRLTLLRPIRDQDGVSQLDVRFDGTIVLHVQWTPETVARTSYKPGAWEAMLRRYDRVPVLAGR
jgi:hypothetical protein